MASTEGPPLDEIQWRSPLLAQQLGGIHTNTIHPYFAASPFFDPQSNNATISNQAQFNPQMYHAIQTREAFESYMSTMEGTQFVVAEDSNATGLANGSGPIQSGQQNGIVQRSGLRQEQSGVWVMRKQKRSSKHGQTDIEVLGLYFVVGENVYKAPTVGSIIGSRLLSISTSLTKLLGTVSPLPLFSPATGHTWVPPIRKPPTGSVASAWGSKEGTPALADTQSIASFSRARQSSLNEKNAAAFDPSDSNLLADSLGLVLRYGHEYMDENPLVGEPGKFIIQKAKDVPAPPRAYTAAAAAATTTFVGTALGEAAKAGLGAASPVPPPPLKTDLAGEVAKKVKGGEKSPLTPGGKKRKRNKATTPKTPK